MKKYLFYGMIFCIFYTNLALAQGCSDAGFCSIERIKNANPSKKDTLNSQFYIKSGFSVGNTRYNIRIFISYLNFVYTIKQKFTLSKKVDVQY